jgi:hypothetical protein
MPRNKSWTDEEVKYLAEMAAVGLSPARAAVRLNRGVAGVTRKAAEIGLPFKNKAEMRRSLGLAPRFSMSR